MDQTTTVYELYTRMLTGEIPQTPQARTLGYQYTTITPQNVVATFPTNVRHHVPYGWVGGGAISMVCDEAMGILFDVNLGNAEVPKTIEYRISFYRAVQDEPLLVTATFRKQGRRVSHLECLVTDSQEREVALATCTMLATPLVYKTTQWLSQMTGPGRA